MNKAQYRAYLQSPAWHAIRARIKARGGERCEGLVPDGPPSHHEPDGRWRRCERTEHLQVHHRSYARIGAERDEDLVLLCLRCHVVAHLEAYCCQRCDEPIFPSPWEAWEEADARFDEAWWAVNGDVAFDAAFDEITWMEQWPYCDYCAHMLTKED